MKPSKKPFHTLPLAVPPEWAPVLGACATFSAVRRDHLDAVMLGQIPIQSIAVVRFVADQSFGKEVEEALPEDALDELAFMRRSALYANG